jgi:hypothetical protein
MPPVVGVISLGWIRPSIGCVVTTLSGDGFDLALLGELDDDAAGSGVEAREETRRLEVEVEVEAACLRLLRFVLATMAPPRLLCC